MSTLLGKDPTFFLKSNAFSHQERIPDLYTCTGKDISPPLTWDHPPKGTTAFALIVEDPDAPVGTFYHWILWNLPGSLRSLPEGVRVKSIDPDIREGKNDFGTIGYRGPCPPKGHKVHHYHFRLYALKSPIPSEVTEGTSARDLKRFLTPLVLGETELVGTYSR